jgi:pyruvyl transferase EpsI
LFISPEHGNLGDHAIALATRIFCYDYMPEIPFIEISYHHYLYDRAGLLKRITSLDLLMINGGGYLGTLWFHDEEMVRDIIKSFPNNRIIIMPQTIFFENDDEGRRQLVISQSIYSHHRQLIFCAREQASSDFVIKNELLASAANCHLIPDMVTYLHGINRNVKRDGVLLCIRKDKESILSDALRREIEYLAQTSGTFVIWTDTVLEEHISFSDRSTALHNIFEQFTKSQLVITDRLHGMMFAAITGTPCIAMNNKSGKVKGCYKTIQHLSYIKIVEDHKDIPSYIKSLMALTNCSYDNQCLLHYYDELAYLIKLNDREN